MDQKKQEVLEAFFQPLPPKASPDYGSSEKDAVLSLEEEPEAMCSCDGEASKQLGKRPLEVEEHSSACGQSRRLSEQAQPFRARAEESQLPKDDGRHPSSQAQPVLQGVEE